MRRWVELQRGSPQLVVPEGSHRSRRRSAPGIKQRTGNHGGDQGTNANKQYTKHPIVPSGRGNDGQMAPKCGVENCRVSANTYTLRGGMTRLAAASEN